MHRSQSIQRLEDVRISNRDTMRAELPRSSSSQYINERHESRGSRYDLDRNYDDSYEDFDKEIKGQEDTNTRRYRTGGRREGERYKDKERDLSNREQFPYKGENRNGTDRMRYNEKDFDNNRKANRRGGPLHYDRKVDRRESETNYISDQRSIDRHFRHMENDSRARKNLDGIPPYRVRGGNTRGTDRCDDSLGRERYSQRCIDRGDRVERNDISNDGGRYKRTGRCNESDRREKSVNKDKDLRRQNRMYNEEMERDISYGGKDDRDRHTGRYRIKYDRSYYESADSDSESEDFERVRRSQRETGGNDINDGQNKDDIKDRERYDDNGRYNQDLEIDNKYGATTKEKGVNPTWLHDDSDDESTERRPSGKIDIVYDDDRDYVESTRKPVKDYDERYRDRKPEYHTDRQQNYEPPVGDRSTRTKSSYTRDQTPDGTEYRRRNISSHSSAHSSDEEIYFNKFGSCENVNAYQRNDRGSFDKHRVGKYGSRDKPPDYSDIDKDEEAKREGHVNNTRGYIGRGARRGQNSNMGKTHHTGNRGKPQRGGQFRDRARGTNRQNIKRTYKPKSLDDYDGETDKVEKNANDAEEQKLKTEIIDMNATIPQLKGPNPNEVFKFMVQIMGGQGSPDHIAREYGGFDLNVDVRKWFQRNRNMFNLIEMNGELVKVLVYRKEAGYCLGYFPWVNCKKEECNMYHICKNYLCGNCMFNPCKFSHDFFDARNKDISRSIRFADVFNNEEIFSIVSARYPHVCESWNDTGCEIERCTKLHLCKQFVLGKCLADAEACTFSHNILSEHNKPIVDAHRMSRCTINLFRKLIYCKRGILEKSDATSENTTIKDDANKHFICIWDLTGNCRRYRDCYDHHLQDKKLPYLWQMKLKDEWMTLEKSEDIESQFCMKETSFNFILVHDGDVSHVKVVFDTNLHALVTSSGSQLDGVAVDVRRLSTRSFMAGDPTLPSFQTQWRWYFRNDQNSWDKFEMNMQFTLESKYLDGQKEFLYSREDDSLYFEMNLKEMTLLNLTNGHTKPVLRRPLFVCAANVEQKLFPENLGSPPKIITPPPKGWFPWDVCSPVELVKLRSDSKQYKEVESSIRETLTDTTRIVIDNIYRVQNQRLWTEYSNREQAMESALELANVTNKGVYKRNLFHGTGTTDAVRGIVTNNFDCRLYGQNGMAYGKGAYFHKNASYSHLYTDDSGHFRYMFRACVLVGDYTAGNRAYMRPPIKPNSANQLFDSCVDNTDKPAIFVLFDMPQYYPEYLIQYHDTGHTSGSPGETDRQCSIM